MADNANFDRLVSGLPLAERQNLLDKLKSQSKISSEPLYTDYEKDAPALNVETEYSRLPCYSRLWYIVLGFIKSKTPQKIFEDNTISALASRIGEQSPGLFNYQKGLLLPAFYRQIVKLKEASRFFYSALDVSVGRDRGAFFAFLGSLEMPDVHSKLQNETDPRQILEKNPDTGEVKLRQIALKVMDDALAMITDDNRSSMYFDARALNCLKELSSFLFDRVLMAFGSNAAEEGETCPANLIREHLAALDTILHSLVIVPPMTLLESLFVFILQEREGENGFDINREIRGLLIKAEDSLEVIREFNKQVPLAWILRCCTRDLSLSPRPLSGGEDWFVFYRDYWKRRIEKGLGDFMKNRRHEELLNTFRYFLKGTNLKTLGNIQSDSNPDGLPVKGAFGLSFLLTFYSAVFMSEINKILRPILIDGEFQRKENRSEFAESYNELIKMEDVIRKFEHEISPAGDYGKRYAQARQDMSALPVKRRKIQIVVDEASEEAEKIIKETQEASRNMVNVLNGILGRDSQARYDSLTNLAKIAGRAPQFMNGLDDAVQQFQRLIKLLDDIEEMENRT